MGRWRGAWRQRGRYPAPRFLAAPFASFSAARLQNHPSVRSSTLNPARHRLPLNWISGTLPSELGQLQRLRVLALDANFFQGTIGNWIGNLRDLEVLTLGANGGINPPEPGSAEGEEGLPGFVGSIPASLASLTKLVELNLQACPGGGGGMFAFLHSKARARGARPRGAPELRRLRVLPRRSMRLAVWTRRRFAFRSPPSRLPLPPRPTRSRAPSRPACAARGRSCAS